MTPLVKDAFYWVRTATGEERDALMPETEWQPARYTGCAADSVGETWDFIGQKSEDGHHFVDVIEVGAAITRMELPESDASLRTRLSDFIEGPDAIVLRTAIGAELDALVNKYGFIRGINVPVVVT